MARPTRRSRRNALRLIAVSGAASLVGCGAPESGDGGDGAGPEDGEEPGDDGEPEADEEPEVPAEEEGEGDETEQQETDGGAEDGDGGDDEGGGEDDAGDGEDGGGDGDDGDGGATDDWAEVDEIVLDGFTAGWEGIEPAPIEGETNPTLVLTEGVEYDLVWENADGQPHNIEIHDGDGEVVGDYSTEIVEAEGERQTLAIEATAEMAEYVCVVHPTTMVGPIEINSG